ncbi:dynamin family protein [Chroococcidiopsis sp. CCALA 051]|nr:dynamin family protein [Chroococcidiopsidales cyanobacterium LEGE 13417]PSM49125.1 dynamin family protein [Chroococcidiopsis sp. CCALA 051]
MISEALKPNVQDLQKDVIDLLEQISSLMHRASTALSSDGTGNKYEEFKQEVDEEAKKVKNLELRMAIVAPMKAGKSTIINAIIGQDILPSRITAMTTLPTEIVFKAELTEPILTLSPEIFSVFQETFLALQSKIQALGIEGTRQKIAHYPHLVKLAEEIRDTVEPPSRTKIFGREEIIKILTKLNDIIRLCSEIVPLQNSLSQLMNVPRIEVPFCRSQNTSHNEKLGNLVIVDTPGPNEAGENLRLTAVVEEQLRKSSIVLIVLDFTQLKTKAAEEVKKEVQKVIQLRGKENLYVLVNKVDQRTEGDMTPEQVRQFVAAELGIGDSGNKNRVFEIAARWAFCATNFLLELQQYPDQDIEQMITAPALAQQALGARWETKLKKVSAEDLQDEAEYLWEESGFAPFLDQAIDALMESAAPRCMKSALHLSRSRLENLKDYIGIRSRAIAQDAEKLQNEVDLLEADLHRLELCHDQLKQVNTIKTQLHQELNTILNDLKKKAKVSLETFLDQEEYHRADFINKRGIEARNITNWFFKQFRLQIEMKGSNLIEFETSREADEFAEKAVLYAKQRIDGLLDDIREKTQRRIETARKNLIVRLDSETKPIIEKARQRLKQAFDVELSLLPPHLETEDMEVAKPHIKSQCRYIDQGYEEREVEKRSFWHWLWIVPYKETERIKRPDKEVNYYTVSLEELVSQINCSTETSIDHINQGINKYLDVDFKQQVDIFFENLDGYLRNYRDSLKQAQADQKLLQTEKEKLVEELNSLVPDAIKKIKDANICIERVDSLLSGE